MRMIFSNCRKLLAELKKKSHIEIFCIFKPISSLPQLNPPTIIIIYGQTFSVKDADILCVTRFYQSGLAAAPLEENKNEPVLAFVHSRA